MNSYNQTTRNLSFYEEVQRFTGVKRLQVSGRNFCNSRHVVSTHSFVFLLCSLPPPSLSPFFATVLFPLTSSSLSALVVLRLSQSGELCVADRSSCGRSGRSLRQIPSLHLQTHTGRTRSSHTGTMNGSNGSYVVLYILFYTCLYIL